MSDRYYPEGTKLEFTPITIEEEVALFKRAKTDDAARDEFVRRHLLYVVKLGRLYGRGRYPESETTSAGNAALMQAMQRFDPSRGVRFCSFLKPYVRAAVAKIFWDDAPVKYSKKMPPRECCRRPLRASEADELGGDTGHDRSIQLPVAERAVSPEFVMVFPNIGESEHKEFLSAKLAEVLKALSKEDRELLRLHYEQGQNFAEIGRLRKVSREAVRRTHNLIMARIKKALAKSGVTEL